MSFNGCYCICFKYLILKYALNQLNQAYSVDISVVFKLVKLVFKKISGWVKIAKRNILIIYIFAKTTSANKAFLKIISFYKKHNLSSQAHAS